ncbi:uncharacterized protein N7483_010645 [Penicillium malachiteum]|uniref:uncharacterized protein n=1 Tax=Penicillium malachiteum TaxID=1324776 RepID=UPI0025470E25|nr:uncharacterized protein N7483_010645 [Penicillium malachiteum]KAJ5713464.1 hypothetical protein N7483_010645 [Penicillium malachiteum]
MKAVIVFMLCLLAMVVQAKSEVDIPSCAVPCLNAAANKAGCDSSDYACICKDVDNIKKSATKCVVGDCGFSVALMAARTLIELPTNAIV